MSCFIIEEIYFERTLNTDQIFDAKVEKKNSKNGDIIINCYSIY